LLRLEKVSTYYRNFEAVKGISLWVGHREMVSLVGANGAGKSTVLRTACGLLRPKKGKVVFKDEEITHLKTAGRVKKGIVYCPEGRKLFPDMTVMENLEMGGFLCNDRFQSNLKRVFDLFPVLQERKGQKVASLSGGQQQMVAIGRTLMSGPEMILFDEPSTGLAPIVVAGLMDVIKRLNQEGMSILLVEQNVNFALEISHRGYVLENGNVVLEGTVDELKHNSRVKESYLGG